MKNQSKKRYPIARLVRFNSAFFQTFLIVLILILILLGTFSVYTLYLENKGLKKSAEDSYLNLLRTTSTATELTLQNLQNLMNQTIWNKDFTNAIINPSSDNYTRTSTIITHLHQIANDYPYVDKAYLYIPTDDTVYSSDLSYLPITESTESFFQDTSDLICFSGSRLSDSRDSLFIQKSAGRLFLCQHLYPDYLRSIGVLIFELNLSSLDLSLAQNTDELTDTCYVFDASGQSVFSAELPKEITQQSAALLNSNSSAKEGVWTPSGNLLYFYYHSPLTNWLYLYPADAKILHFQPSLSRIISLGSLVAILGLIFAFQIAFRANRPIRSLLKEMTKTNPDAIDAKNEIDYLTQVYHYTTAQNQQLHQAIRSITPLVLERLFSDILSGRAPIAENIEATLESLGQPIPQKSRFMAMDLEITNKSGNELTILEMNLHVIQLRNLFSQTLPEKYQSYLIAREDLRLAAVLVLPPGVEDEAVREQVSLLCRKLDSQKLTTSYQLQTGCGNIYTRLKDVRYSYLEAQKNLNHLRFYGSGEQSPPPESLPSQNRYFEKTRQIVRCIQENRLAESKEQAEQLIEEIADSCPVNTALEQYREFLNTLLEITDALHIISTEELSLRQEALLTRLKTLSDNTSQKEEVKAFCSEALGLIEHRNRTKASQHISRIQEYIHANYSNSSLSLYMASEQVGISPSYLSRLFKQEMGASFVDYINSFRVEKAKHLLESSDIKIKDIAFQTGFNSMQNFFRIFKKHTGMSPGEYRQKHFPTNTK